MPTFNYTARDREGQQFNGVLAAADGAQVREMLRQKELFLVGLQEKGETAASGSLFGQRKVKLNDLVVMSRQFATLVSAGMPIVECLFTLQSQAENPTLALTLEEVRNDVVAGATLADAMARKPKVFNELYVSLVRAGESAGILEETLEVAATQFEKEEALRGKVKTAFLYPALVMLTSVAVVVILLTFVVPVFERVYSQFNAQLPPVTRALVAISQTIRHYWWMVALGGIAAGYGLARWVKTPNGRLRYDRFKLRIPLFGKLARKIAIARFTRTMSAMVRAGVPILEALKISGRTSGNVVIVGTLDQVARQVSEGARLSAPIEQTGEFPAMLPRMIAAGESSGNLDTMLEKLATFYERDIEQTIDRMTRLLEPALTIVIGGVVLFVLLALYMPVFNLTNVLRRP